MTDLYPVRGTRDLTGDDQRRMTRIKKAIQRVSDGLPCVNRG